MRRDLQTPLANIQRKLGVTLCNWVSRCARFTPIRTVFTNSLKLSRMKSVILFAMQGKASPVRDLRQGGWPGQVAGRKISVKTSQVCQADLGKRGNSRDTALSTAAKTSGSGPVGFAFAFLRCGEAPGESTGIKSPWPPIRCNALQHCNVDRNQILRSISTYGRTRAFCWKLEAISEADSVF